MLWELQDVSNPAVLRIPPSEDELVSDTPRVRVADGARRSGECAPRLFELRAQMKEEGGGCASLFIHLRSRGSSSSFRRRRSKARTPFLRHADK